MKLLLTVNKSTVRIHSGAEDLDPEYYAVIVCHNNISSVYHFHFNKNIIVCRFCKELYILKLSMIRKLQGGPYIVMCPICHRIDNDIEITVEDTEKAVREFLCTKV